jgi:hypothetical protein
MTTLQYEDSGCRQKQIQKEKDEFAIGFAEWISYKYKFLLDKKGWFRSTYELEMGIFISSQELLEIYKKEIGL